MQNTIIADYQKPITKKEFLKIVRKEKKRLFNKINNILFYFEVKDYFIKMSFKQIKNIVNNLSMDDNGHIHQNYDDNNEFILIEMEFDTEGKNKTKIYIHG